MAKAMTGKEVKALKVEELDALLTQTRSKLFKLKSQSVSEKVEDTGQFVQLRRDVARMLTEKRAREIAARK
jgi:ribosomal protein L29